MDLNDQAESMSQNRFDAVTEFPDHVAFARKLLDSYEWDEETAERFKSQLDGIQAKHDDRFLNLSVIGEFSTGKSTFINALLRRNGFLDSSSLQGTTTTATIIENSDKFALILNYADNTKDKREFETCDELKKCFSTISLDPEQASSLYNVTLQLPAPLLAKKGFRIIDTPGVNSNERWHDDVTIRTIKEMSDLSIIIIDATKALPQQFCEFICSNLQAILDNCVFVITKVNMIRKRELEGVIKYIREKAQKEFDISDPLILPYASLDILENIEKLDNTIDLPELISASLNSEKKMMEHMSSQKSIIQTLNLIELADKMYDMVQKHLDEIAQKQAELLHYANVKRNLPVEMERFKNNRSVDIGMKFAEAAANAKTPIMNFTQKQFKICYDALTRELSSKNSFNDFMQFLNNDFQIRYIEEMRRLLYKVNNTSGLIQNEFKAAIASYVKQFAEVFNEYLYSEKLEKQYKNVAPDLDFMCFPMLNFVSVYINRYTQNRGVIGTIIPKNYIPAAQSGMVRDSIAKIIQDCLTDTYKNCDNDIQKYINRTKECVYDTISNYTRAYQEYARETIDPSKVETPDDEIRRLQADVQEINMRKGKLDMISRLLNIMNRKDRV